MIEAQLKDALYSRNGVRPRVVGKRDLDGSRLLQVCVCVCVCLVHMCDMNMCEMKMPQNTLYTSRKMTSSYM